jgi:hypothetical protein
MAAVQFSTPDMPDNDGFYHIKIAYLMRTESLTPDFTWLPLSILNQREFYDHHFLFHVLLIPFTLGDLRIGAKIAAVVFASLAFLSLWWLLHKQKIAFAPFWALGLAALSEAFIFRMSITRAQSLSLLILMFALDALLRKKVRSLAVIAFLYVWLYDAFPLLIIIAGLYTLTAWWYEKRFDWKPLVYSGVGIAAGLIINPYFPHNIVFAVQHILPKLSGGTSISVGSEWFPYDTTQLLSNSLLVWVFLFGGIFTLGANGKRMDLRTTFSLLLVGLFGFMLFQSRRFIEYFPAFVLIFSAFAWNPVIQGSAGGKLIIGFPWLRKIFARFPRLHDWLPGLALLLILVPGLLLNVRSSAASIGTSKPYSTYAGASNWLTENTDAGALVFQTDWDDFPRLFFYNTHNTYLIGLDPTYMQIYDPQLYDRWVEITRGNADLPGKIIFDEFASRYTITDLRHTDFIRQAEADPSLQIVYQDAESIVFEYVP